jgi:hypothetical protein
MDANKDGKLTPEEIEMFWTGRVSDFQSIASPSS